MSSIALLTFAKNHAEHGSNYVDMVRPCLDSRRSYAAKHGFTLYDDVLPYYDPTRPASWSKLRMIAAVLHKHEWVFWSDADVLVTESGVRIEDILSWFDTSKDFIIAEDLGGVPVNCGNFFVRNSPWAHEFLKRWWDQTHMINSEWWEQSALIELLKTPEVREHFQITQDRRMFNAYPKERFNTPSDLAWQPGDFQLHISGVRGQEFVNILNLYLPQCR